MPDMIDTSFPAWLAARNAPHQQSPWILQAMQQGMQREEMRQKLPLQLQEMALQNQANALAIHRQSILNDQADQNMLEYRDQLPRFKEWYATTKGDPVAVASTFPQGISNPQLVKEVGDLQLAASRSLVVEARKQNIIEDGKLYHEASRAGLRLNLGPDGLLSEEDRKLAGDAIRKAKVADEIAMRTASHPDTLAAKTEDLEKARQDYEAAIASGDQKMIASTKSRYETMQSLAIPPNETIEMGVDENGRPTAKITRGKVGTAATPDALTTAGRTRVQEAQAQSLATIDVANRLEPLISDETVGARAFAESWIKDRILAQQFPDLVNQNRVKAEQLAAQLRATAVKELRSDGNITEGERRQILEAIPTINDPIDSPTRAKALTRDIRKMAAIRALVAAKRLGSEVPKSAAIALDDETLVDLAMQGLITKDQAKQAYSMKPR